MAGVVRAWLVVAVAGIAACGVEEHAPQLDDAAPVERSLPPHRLVVELEVPADEIVVEVETPEPPSRTFAVEKPGWLPPVKGAITSRFGPRPKGDGTELHDALDIAAEMGTEVVAPADLVVVWIAYQTRAGRYLQADLLDDAGTPTGHRLTFAHLSSTAVFEGDRVRRGEKLGLIGLSGSASGPHLHLKVEELREDGEKVAVDPLALFEESEIVDLSNR